MRWPALLGLTALAACSQSGQPVRMASPGMQRFITGNAADVVTPTRGLWVAQGGGDDVDLNYARMGEFGGGGDFVVLRASGKAEYNDYIFGLCRCDSVETLVFSSREAAYDPAVAETIRNAEALFIGGGDQSNYVKYWKGTPVEDAINHVAAKPAPIGGTSAGMAVLGEYVYSAMGTESLTSAVAMADPFAPDVTLERDFLVLPGLEDLLTDQHLQERDRIGRTLALLCRIMEAGWSRAPRGIAADRETAVHVDPADRTAEVFATADHPTPYAYFLRPTRPPDRCRPGLPLTLLDVDVYRIGPGGRFDLDDWKGSGGIHYRLGVRHGVLESSRGEVY